MEVAQESRRRVEAALGKEDEGGGGIDLLELGEYEIGVKIYQNCGKKIRG